MLIGVDIGGGSAKIGVVAENRIIERRSLPTGAEISADEMLGKIADECLALVKKYQIMRVGVGSPGYVDMAAGVVTYAVNLRLSGVPVAGILEKRLGLPVTLANDANCAAVGEFYAGSGIGAGNLIFVTLGTGIGGGIILGGKLYTGSDGRAGEIGHICVEVDGEDCGCGRRGCWERYASASGLVRMAEAAAAENPESELARLVKRGASGRTVFEALRAGCPVGSAVFDRYMDYLATGIFGLENIFSPDKIIIGGGISAAGDELLLPLREKLGVGDTLQLSALGNDAGLIGAALMYRQFEM